MPIRLRSVFVLSALVLFVPAAASAQGQQPPGPGAPPRDTSARKPPVTGTAVVRGRVVALETGLPLRRARVSLYGEGQPRTTTTDAEGAFTFDQLPAGRYQVRASKTGYVDTPNGARRPGGPGRPLDVADGRTIESLTLALPPAGVIAGRVLDDVGDPVAGARVVVMRYRTVNGERQLTTAGSPRVTDDIGSFRLYGLTPGKYYVSAVAEESRLFNSDAVDADPTGFAPTYYPNTPVAAEAQPIEVAGGAEVFADVQLALARLTTVTGIVVSPAGAPATGGYVMVTTGARRGGMMSSRPGGTIKPDGTFRVQGLPPGEYSLLTQPSFGEPPLFEPHLGSRGQGRTASAVIVANGEPISGLRLVVQDPIRIPVSVTFEDGAAERPERVFVNAEADRGLGGGRAALQDGRLSLDVVPGFYRLSAGVISAGRTPSGARWFAKRIVYRGEDVEGEEIELTAEPGGRIDVVLTTRSSDLTGGVTDSGGTPLTEYRVILIPEDAEVLRRDADRVLRFANPDEQGRFRFQHLRPGRYLATAIPDEPIDDVYDLDFLDGIRRAGKPVTIAEGGSAEVALKLAALP